MSAYLSTLAAWGTSIYYSTGIANNLFMPSYIKYQSPPSRLATDLFPEVFYKVEKLRKDIVIYSVPNLPYAAAIGTNFGHSAVLLINGDLASIDNEALRYICKHELSHVNTNDGLIASSLATVSSAVSTFAIPYLQSLLPTWATPITYALPYIVGVNVYNAAMLIFENRADSFATRHATSEELLGIERFIRAHIEVNKSLAPTYPQLFSADGNTRLLGGDITHGSLSDRLHEIRLECRKRNIEIPNDAEQAEQMEKLKTFHRNLYKNIKKLKVD